MKLWQKGYEIDGKIEAFCAGKDPQLDISLVEYDCIASKAHAKALWKAKLLTKKEFSDLITGLNEIIGLHSKGKFPIGQKDEDCHTAIENYLTKKFGDCGKKIHAARSRNDQVLTALRLYEKAQLREIMLMVENYELALKKAIGKYGRIEMPGYTHMQKAMPTTVSMWLGSFIDSAKDNKIALSAVLGQIDQSPLGTAAGFGIPILKIDRSSIAMELGFAKLQQNPMYAQLSRGKFEASIIQALLQVLFDINKLASDLMLFSMQEFRYVTIPRELCSGSSIMPQKKNPDCLELLRASYHSVVGEQMKVQGIICNLISGYNRDVQLTKEPVMVAIETAKSCLEVMALVVSSITINKKACRKAMSRELYATEEAYKLVKRGIPFREAYRQIAKKY
jgi:argininosuccinate lyase